MLAPFLSVALVLFIAVRVATVALTAVPLRHICALIVPRCPREQLLVVVAILLGCKGLVVRGVCLVCRRSGGVFAVVFVHVG